jgi:hypothetical protein
MKPTLPPTAKPGIRKPNRSEKEMFVNGYVVCHDSNLPLGTERSVRIGADIFERSGSDSIS